MNNYAEIPGHLKLLLNGNILDLSGEVKFDILQTVCERWIMNHRLSIELNLAKVETNWTLRSIEVTTALSFAIASTAARRPNRYEL